MRLYEKAKKARRPIAGQRDFLALAFIFVAAAEEFAVKVLMAVVLPVPYGVCRICRHRSGEAIHY